MAIGEVSQDSAWWKIRFFSEKNCNGQMLRLHEWLASNLRLTQQMQQGKFGSYCVSVHNICLRKS